MRRTLLAMLLVLMAVALTGEPAFAQTETGKITGSVTDASGAVVPGVTVTVRNTGTESTRLAVTDSNGSYVIASVLPANYEVSFELTGFRRVTQTVRVPVGGEVTVDARLEVGNLAEVVQVSASVVEPINLRTPEVSTSVRQEQIRELPTLTRDPYDLVALAGNVSDQDPTGVGETSGRGVNGYSINGLRSSATNALLDGAANNDEFTGAVGQSVPLDSVQEFSIISSNFSAQYGRATAGIVNVATKSGTNDFHGTVYEFFRNEKFSSRTVDQKAREIEKSPFERHQPGFSIGGPVRRNQMQFFTSMEFIRVRSDATDISWIPTPEFLARTAANTQGFFAKYPLETPINGPVITRGEIGGTAGGPFAALPASLPVFGQVQRKLPVDAGGGDPQNTVQFVGRLDWTMGANMNSYLRYALENKEFLAGSLGNSPFRGFDTGEDINNHNALFSLTRVWSSRFTTQSKVVVNRLKDVQPLGDQPDGPTLYARSTPTSVQGVRIAFPGYLPFQPGSAIPFGGPQNLLQTYQDGNWLTGNHDLRFGGSYVYIRDNRSFGAYQNSVQTLGSSLNQAMDNLVLGQLLSYAGAVDPQGKFPGEPITLPARQPNFTRNNRYHEWAAYFNDAWSIRPTVTVNLGVRYEYYGVQHNKDPRLDSNFYYGAGNQFERIRNGSVQIAPDSPVGSLWRPDKNNFAPRLGFAWDVRGNGRTSVRGGYGMAYERNFGNVTFNVIQNPPAYAVVALTAPSDAAVIPITTDNAGPLAGTGTKILPGTSLRHVDENIVNAFAQFWSASVQQQLGNSSTVSIDYTGSAGDDQYTIENTNRVGAGAVYLGDPTPNTRLNRQYTSANTRGQKGKSRYHAVILGLDNRGFGESGLTFTSRYTWSHAKDNLSSTFSESNNNFVLGLLDPFNPNLDYGFADFDIRHRAAVGALWEIPAGRNSSGGMRQLIGGWQINAILTAQSGAPFTIWDCTNAGPNGVCMRMLAVGSLDKSGSKNPPSTGDPNSYQYIDLTSQLPAAGSYVNPITGTAEFGPYPSNMTDRNVFRRPGKWNVNAMFGKRFRFADTRAVQIRFELYNLFNHANLYVDDSAADISGGPIITAFRGDKGEGDGVPQGDGQIRMQFGVKFEF